MQTATITITIGGTDVSADVLDGIRWNTGITSATPSSLVASTGTLEFQLNNSASNANTTAGYYSPGHGSAWSTFEIGAVVVLKSNYSAADRYQFKGKITDIEVMPGQYRGRRTRVTVADYIDDMATRYIDPLALQVNQRSDQLLTTLIATMDTAPANTSYATGPDIAKLSFYDLQGEKQTVLSIAQKIAQMGMSRIYVKGDATDGQTLVLENRSADVLKSSQLTLTNTMQEMEVTRMRSSIINKAVVNVTTPEEGTAYEVIYSLPEEKNLNAGQVWTFTALFRDPDGGRRICANDVQTSQTANTDYSASAVSGSLAGDLNSSLGIVISNIGSDRCTVQLTNNASKQMYITLFQFRGKVLRLRDAIETTDSDATSITAYDERRQTYSAPYQSNLNTTQSIAEFIVANWKDPQNIVKRVRYIGNITATLMAGAVNRDIGDLITITEAQTGISEVRVILGRTVNVKSKGIWEVEYITMFIPSYSAWLLGSAGNSELGDTTYLGF